jgi:hypothetical protein
MGSPKFAKQWLRTATFVLAPLALSCTTSVDRESVMRGYVDSVNRNDVSAALAFHTPDAEFIIPGQPPIRGIEAMRSLLQYDSVLQSTLSFGPGIQRGDTLFAGQGSERNGWFRGIGLDSIAYASGTRFVFEGALIKGIYPESLVAETASEFEVRVEAFMSWAAENAPDELSALMPDGLFRYDRESAEAWLILLARYAGRDDS